MNVAVAVCSNDYMWGDISFYVADNAYNGIVVHCNVANFYSSHILHKNRVDVQIYLCGKTLDNTLCVLFFLLRHNHKVDGNEYQYHSYALA